MAANIKAWWASAWRTMTKIRFWDGAAWVEIVRVRRWTQTSPTTLAWKDVYIKGGTTPPPSPPPVPPPPPPPPATRLTVRISPASVSGSKATAGTVTTNEVTVSASGGTGPYDYVYSKSSGFTASNVITNSPGANKTSFSLAMALNTQVDGNMKVVVTDAHGVQGSKSIPVSFICGTPSSGDTVDWSDINILIPEGSVHVVSKSNAAQTMVAAGTLNWADTSGIISAYKNNALQGPSFSVVVGDSVYFRAGSVDAASGVVTVSGVTSDAFNVTAEIL